MLELAFKYVIASVLMLITVKYVIQFIYEQAIYILTFAFGFLVKIWNLIGRIILFLPHILIQLDECIDFRRKFTLILVTLMFLSVYNSEGVAECHYFWQKNIKKMLGMV
jgi:hypothetical protein